MYRAASLKSENTLSGFLLSRFVDVVQYMGQNDICFSAVGAQVDRFSPGRNGFREAPSKQQHSAVKSMGIRHRVINCHCLIRALHCLLEEYLRRVGPMRAGDLPVKSINSHPCDGKIRVENYRMLEQFESLINLRMRTADHAMQSANKIIPRFDIVGLTPTQARLIAFRKVYLERDDDLAGNLVLERKNIADLPVVSFRPDVTLGPGFDELRGDPHAIVCGADASFKNVANAQIPRDIRNLDRAPLVDERRIACDHLKFRYLGQGRDDVFGDAVGKIFLIRVARHIFKRQHRDRRLVGQQGRRIRDLQFGLNVGVQTNTCVVDANGLRNILVGLFAEIFKRRRKLSRRLVANRARDINFPGLAKAFQASARFTPSP